MVKRNPMTRGAAVGDNQSVLHGALTILFGGLLYVVGSATMISFNSWLMHKDHFPFAVALVLMHSISGTVLAVLLFIMKPNLFPSLTDPLRKVPMNRKVVLSVLPIAVTFAGQMIFTHMTYRHSDLAFIQMMRESNLVLVYFFSLIAMLEVFKLRYMALIVCVVGATMLTIEGERHITAMGMSIQVTSQVFDSLRLVLQAFLLQKAGLKLDVLTYVLMVMPCCAVILSAILFGFGCLMPELPLPTMAMMVNWWPYLVPNMVGGFVLNLLSAFFLKHSSACSYVLASIMKDYMVVTVGVAFMKDPVSSMQITGFSFQVCAIVVWSMMRLFPDKFDAGFGEGIKSSVSQVLNGFSEKDSKDASYGSNDSKC